MLILDEWLTVFVFGYNKVKEIILGAGIEVQWLKPSLATQAF